MRVRRFSVAAFALASAALVGMAPAVAASPDATVEAAAPVLQQGFEVASVEYKDGLTIVETEAGRTLEMWAETADGDIRPMDAQGCTAAPGNLGAQNCVTVVNPTPLGGVVLDLAYGSYIAPSVNICNQTTQFKYTDRTASPNKTRTQTSTSCAYGINQQMWDPSPNITLQHSSDFCARTKNTASGGVYSNWACVRIIA